MEQKCLQPRILYLASLSLKFEAMIKQFSDKERMKKFTTTKAALQDILKRLTALGGNVPKAK